MAGLLRYPFHHTVSVSGQFSGTTMVTRMSRPLGGINYTQLKLISCPRSYYLASLVGPSKAYQLPFNSQYLMHMKYIGKAVFAVVILIPKPIFPEKALAPHSSTLAWTIPWMEEPGRLQSMGLLRVGHD